MASGSLGAKELPREKHKWSENSKVYTRKIHRNPKNNNSSSSSVTSNPAASISQSNDKNKGETSDRIAVESNGGDKKHVANGTSVINNVEKNHEIITEEVPNSENSTKEVPDTANENVEKDPENIVEEVSISENSIKEVPTTADNVVENNYESIPVEVPGNGNIVEERPDDGKSVEEVADTVNSVKEAPTNGNNVKDVPCNGDNTEEISGDVKDTENNEQDIEVVHNSENSVEEAPRDENIIEEARRDENNIEEGPHAENNIEEAPHNENNIEEAPLDENNIEELPHGENNVEDVPDNDINTEEEEEVPRKSFSLKLPIKEGSSLQPQQNLSRMETVTLSEDSLSHDQEMVLLSNGHDHDGTLVNGMVRDERPMVTQVDDRLSISVTAAKSKEEVRDLKRKLEDELDQVRKMARKLEVKETQLSEIPIVGRLHSVPAVGRLHFPVNGGMDNGVSSMRGNQELGSVSYNHSRPFGPLSVAVMDNGQRGVGEIPYEKEKRTPKANPFYRNSDFLLGKEKLPPAESNKKAKSSGGGRKHGGGESESGIGFDKHIYKKCGDLLQKMRNHKHGWVFNKPVDVKSLGLHDYFDIIKHPMDLGTVKARLTNNWYKTPREFAEDVRLTFYNAMTYNPEGQDVHIMAKELLRIFEEKWPAIETEYDRKLRYEMFRDLEARTPTSRKSYAPAHVPIRMPLPAPPVLHHPPFFHEARNLERSQSMPVRPESRPKPTPSVGRTPAPKKPKAKDPNKRDMTFDEKQKLSTNLQSLPSEKLDAIVQIIKKRNSALSQHDDEIEVDIDSVDAETLWELDRFVTNYKKSLSKHKRKAELAMQARAAAGQAIPETAPPAPSNVEPPRENQTDEGNAAAASPHAQQERHSGNASDSSSSSSSSSGSGSSSSDSDSDSSSDSDSDEEN